MDTIVAQVRLWIETFDWKGPEVFVLFGVIVFGVTRRWVPLVLVIATAIVGANIERYVQFTYTINNADITTSFIVYIVGGILIAFAAFLSFFNR